MKLPGLKGEWAEPDKVEWARDQWGWVPTYTFTIQIGCEHKKCRCGGHIVVGYPSSHGSTATCEDCWPDMVPKANRCNPEKPRR